MTTSTTSQLRATTDLNPFATGSVAAGAYLLANAIDNRETAGSVVAYDLADLQLIISGVTPNAGGFVTVWALEAIDGGTTNYATPAAASAAPPSLVRGTYWAANVATSVINITDLRVGPYSFKLLIQNNLGVGITLNSSALQRKTYAGW